MTTVSRDLTSNFAEIVTQNVEHGLKGEKSRIVKIALIKYKCILMLTFFLLCVMQFIYIIVKEILKDNNLYELLSALTNNNNNTNRQHF